MRGIAYKNRASRRIAIGLRSLRAEDGQWTKLIKPPTPMFDAFGLTLSGMQEWESFL